MPSANVLLITCHDLGRHLGCYGQATVRSPHLDQLAGEGMRLDQMFCTAPQCSPSRASLATGRHPHSNGCMGLAHAEFGWSIGPEEQHLARLLSETHQTVLIGGQHVTPAANLDQLGFAANLGGGTCQTLAARFSEWLPARDTAQPFYCEINFAEPHRPYDREYAPPDESLGVALPGWVDECPAAYQEFAQLQGLIHTVDASIGQVLAALDAAGLRDETLVIFIADHGLAMPRAKCTLYDAGLGTACLVRWPGGGIAPGLSSSAMLSNIDVLPTILEALGQPVTDRVQGRSFWPLLTGGTYQPRQEVFAEKTYHGVYDPMRCIRTEGFKFIRNFNTGRAVDVPGDAMTAYYSHWILEHGRDRRVAVELYDLHHDPDEQANLAGGAHYTEIEAELDRRLWEHLEATGDPILDGPIPSPFYLRQLAARRSS